MESIENYNILFRDLHYERAKLTRFSALWAKVRSFGLWTKTPENNSNQIQRLQALIRPVNAEILLVTAEIDSITP